LKEVTGLNKEEFTKLLSKIGLGHDVNLVDKLFWIFDEDGNGEVDHKELAIGLEFFQENTFEEKLDKFFELCDEDGNGTINRKEFYNLLKVNMINDNDKFNLKQAVQEIFCSIDKDGDGELTKTEMRYACRDNNGIRALIDKNVKALKDVDHWIESDLSRPFQTRVTFSLSNTNSKHQGTFFPAINNMLNALKETEEIKYNVEKIKNITRVQMRKLYGKSEEGDSSEAEL